MLKKIRPLRIALIASAAFTVLFGASLYGQTSEGKTIPDGFEPLRVAFWNVEWFPGKRPDPTVWEEKGHVPLVQTVVENLDPDILGMVEIRNEDAAKLGTETVDGLHVDICSRFRNADQTMGRQQIAIASKLTPVSAWSEAWQERSGVSLPRGFSFAAYPMGANTVVLVYTLHYKSNRGEIQQNIPAREASTKQLLAHAKQMEEIYGQAYKHVVVILGGDFNTSLDDTRFSRERSLRDLQKAGFTWTWEKTPKAERTTLPSQPQMDPSRPPYPDASFDHIFVKGARILGMEAPKTDPIASDHRPVVAELLIPVQPATAP